MHGDADLSVDRRQVLVHDFPGLDLDRRIDPRHGRQGHHEYQDRKENAASFHDNLLVFE